MTRIPLTHTGSGWFTGTRPDGLIVHINTFSDGNRAVGVWEQLEYGMAIRGSGTLRPEGNAWVGECEEGKKKRTVRWDGRVVEFGE